MSVEEGKIPRKTFYNVQKTRVHDYLYDTVFCVSSGRDYARTAFRAAMESAQINLQPVYKDMFSSLRPSNKRVLYGNCRLPPHMDVTFQGYMARVSQQKFLPTPDIAGRDIHKFIAVPKQLLPLKKTSPIFEVPRPHNNRDYGLSNKKIQTVFRVSSAQTYPWQPDAKEAEGCENTPEVLYLEKLFWGPGKPYRTGDLPADFHTTEIINKMRHARIWTELIEKATFPDWMKKRNAIIEDIETKDWIFREAEIDELQQIRLTLLGKLQQRQRKKIATKVGAKLDKLWTVKKKEMERKIQHINQSRDRELRKLAATHNSGGRLGLVDRLREARGGGKDVYSGAGDAPLARNGYQARRRHADIQYNPDLLLKEDHDAIAAPPAWLGVCGIDLGHTCSGHHLPKPTETRLCPRETRWTEDFLRKLHEDLKKGREPPPLRPLSMLVRRPGPPTRHITPALDAVPDEDETNYQSALLLQKNLRGRAVQILMYEGRTRAAELTEELKTTHGLQLEDKERIAEEGTMAKNYSALRTEAEAKECAITALADELCGGAAAAALDLLEKELRRLQEERRQHAFILVAVRDKTMREAAEAGRRQKEEHRRKEHDEMFKHVLGVTQDTVDDYLKEIIAEGVALAAEEQAISRARVKAETVEVTQREYLSSAEENELVAELVHQFLLPEAHKTASRRRVTALQDAHLGMARKEIFGIFDRGEVKEAQCIRCGTYLNEKCRCIKCKTTMEPVEKPEFRHDRRWARVKRAGTSAPPKTVGDRYPPYHEFRCMLNALIDEVVDTSKEQRLEREQLYREYKDFIEEKVYPELEARDLFDMAFNLAMGEWPARRPTYKYFMRRHVVDAIHRDEPKEACCPPELPSEIRRRAEEDAYKDPTCCCEELDELVMDYLKMTPEEIEKLLPSKIRELEDLRRCKCDVHGHPSAASAVSFSYEEETYGEYSSDDFTTGQSSNPANTPT